MFHWIKKVVSLLLLVFVLLLVVIEERKFNIIIREKVILTDTSRHLVKTIKDEHYREYYECWNETRASKFQNISIKQGQNMDEIHHTINNICTKPNITCPTPNFQGYVGVNVNISRDLKDAFMSHLSFVYHGGWWSPSFCNRKTYTVAIIIPFRDREEHLPVLIQHLHPILQRQQLHYRFFVVKQDKDYSFNKGMLVNAGFIVTTEKNNNTRLDLLQAYVYVNCCFKGIKEILQLYPYDCLIIQDVDLVPEDDRIEYSCIKEILQLYPYECLIIQDVDLVPENDRIDYSCKVSPLHLAGLIDKFNYILHSPNNFGGVVSLSTEHYIQINGFSNLFWSWGGEDDNMHERIVLSGLKQKRENLTIARYTMLKHVNRMYAKTKKDWKDTNRIYLKAKEHWQADGYNSVVYRMNEMKVEDLYTSIEFNLVKERLIP